MATSKLKPHCHTFVSYFRVLEVSAILQVFDIGGITAFGMFFSFDRDSLVCSLAHFAFVSKRGLVQSLSCHETSFIHVEMNRNLRVNKLGLARGHALKVRPKATRKSPINSHIFAYVLQ